MSSKRTSRRNFLFGRSFLGRIRSVAEKAVTGTGIIDAEFPPLADVSSSDWPILTISRAAMASDFEISLNRGQYPQGIAAAVDALDEVERLEEVLSVFRTDSSVSFINSRANHEPAELTAELFALIGLCVKIAQETECAADITSSPLWRLWGFAKRAGTIPDRSEIKKTLATVGVQHLELGEPSRTIAFKKPGMEISFGCIGKGAALDAVSQKLETFGVNDYLIHGGRSSILARGGHIGDVWGGEGDVSPEEEPSTAEEVPSTVVSKNRATGWTVGVANPIYPGKRLAAIRLCDEALGTSGSQQQFFYAQGKRYAHIIDPRTGFPAEGVLMATVVAPTAALADILSTAFFVLGPEKTQAYCDSHPGVAALLVVPTGHANDFEIRHFGFEKNQITSESL